MPFQDIIPYPNRQTKEKVAKGGGVVGPGNPTKLDHQYNNNALPENDVEGQREEHDVHHRARFYSLYGVAA